MARILFAWELGGGLGHCARLAPLAAGLIARGHDVVFAARDVVTAQRVGRGLPIVYLPVPHLEGRPSFALPATTSLAHVLHNSGYGDAESLAALVASWRTLIDLVQPAAMLCEHAPTALLASRWVDLPRFAIGTGFSLPPDVAPLPDLRPRPSSSAAALQSVETRIVERINAMLSADRLPPLARLSQLYADVDGRFLATFEELDHHGARQGDQYRGTWPLGGGAAAAWDAGDRPRIFAYLKRDAPQWDVQAAIAALARLPAQAIVYVAGAGRDLARLQSPMLRLAPEPLDVDAICRQCDLAVLHGTAGATTQFLRAGVPVLLAPLFFEQAVLSVRVADMGAGLVMNPRRIGELDQPAKLMLTSQTYRQAAQRFAAQHAAYDAGAEQAAIVETLDVAVR